MASKVTMSCVVMVTLVLICSSSAQMSAKSKAKVSIGLDAGSKVVDYLSKLGDPKVRKVFDVLGKMSGFLGAFGGLVSFILAFLPKQDSLQLKYMKEKFSEVNMKLDKITEKLEDMKDVITYENQRSAYVTTAAKIMQGADRLKTFLAEMQKTPCTTRNDCRRIRGRIISRFIKDFDVEADIFMILNGAVKPTSVFGDPLLNIIQKESKCNIRKINHFSNAVLLLSFKAQQLILTHEKLTGSGNSITRVVQNWLVHMYNIRKNTDKIKKQCFDKIKQYMIQDIKDKKYQTDFSSNGPANKALKSLLELKYPWLDWVVQSYGAYGGQHHYVINYDGAFFSMPPKNDRKRNIIATFVDKKGTYKNQKYTAMRAMDQFFEKAHFSKKKKVPTATLR